MSEEEFTSVLSKNQGIIFKVANSYCNNIDDRDDLIQEITIQLWKSHKKYNPKFKHSTWIYRISLNVAISFFRRNKKHNNSISMENKENLLYTQSESNSENIEQLYQFIYQLDELNKALILLYLESYSYEEIALTLGISKTNVATKISRIKNLLKDKFNQEN